MYNGSLEYISYYVYKPAPTEQYLKVYLPSISSKAVEITFSPVESHNINIIAMNEKYFYLIHQSTRSPLALCKILKIKAP